MTDGLDIHRGEESKTVDLLVSLRPRLPYDHELWVTKGTIQEAEMNSIQSMALSLKRSGEECRHSNRGSE